MPELIRMKLLGANLFPEAAARSTEVVEKIGERGHTASYRTATDPILIAGGDWIATCQRNSTP